MTTTAAPSTDDRGFRVRLQPPEPDDAYGPRINKAIREYTRMDAQLIEAEDAWSAATEALTNAEQADTERYGEALRAGGGDPGQPATEAAQAALAQATRRRDAARLAVGGAERDLVTVIERERDRTLAIMAEQDRADRDAELAAYDTAGEIRRRRVRRTADTKWLMDPAQPYRSPGVGPLASLIGQNGLPLGWGVVMGALRARAEAG